MSNDVLHPGAAPDAPTETLFEIISVADPATGNHEIIEALIEPATGTEVIEIFHTSPEGVHSEIIAIESGSAAGAEAHHVPAPGMGPSIDPVDTTSHAGEHASHASDGGSADHAGEHTPHDSTGETTVHAEAAADYQHQADAFVASGDYQAAEHARDSAENEAWAAGNHDMLHGSNSAELQSAADHQGEAAHYEHHEAQDAAAGHYEAARDDAAHAVDATGWADFNAMGSDHTGHAAAEYQQEDWAVSEQHQANDYAHTADAYAAEGDHAHAAQYHEAAADHQQSADAHGHAGEHHDAGLDHDHAFDAHGNVHDASYDTHDSSYDTHDSHTE